MKRNISCISTLLVFIFMFTMVLPPDLFSYEANAADIFFKEQKDWVDESKDYSATTYKKVRCPRCGIEFYYIPGKESPHSHWVNYETQEKDGESDVSKRKAAASAEDRKKKLLTLIKNKKNIKEIEEFLSREEGQNQEDEFLSSEGLEVKEYELRLRLICPYDGYAFFPEGDIIEDAKMMPSSFISSEPSVIEKSFSKAISFGVSKEMKQFGYDLFAMQKKEMEAETAQKGTKAGQDALGALGMLKAAFTTEPVSPSLSMKSSGGSAVIPVGPEYVIGPGDTLVINIWGSVQESFPVEIDREGKIMLPKAGPLYVWGLKLKETEEKIKKRLDQFYTNFYMDLSMGKLRDIQVYVIGEVKSPGSYTINSQTSIFQVLYEAGGPTKLGSLRKIKILHSDGKSEIVDLYPFLLEGKNIEYAKIMSGDTVFVPSIGDVVAIAGNVKRPAIYETKSDIVLSDLLDFAGGITPTGDMQRLQVERIVDNEKRVMVDIELQKTQVGKFSLENISMQNGDLVIVSPIVRLKHDFVSVIGNVERPGDYGLSKNMKVSDLIKRAKGFMPGTYLYRAEMSRVTKDRTREILPVNLDRILTGDKEEDILLDEWDILIVYSEAEVMPPSFVEISGAVNRPGVYEVTPGMNVSDLIFKGGGLMQDKVIRGAELFHIVPGEQPVVRELVIKQISGANISIDKDIILRAGDALFIKSEPKLTERRVFAIKGEVRFPGTYSIKEGERLSSLIERAGGFTNEAFLEGSIFNRKSIREVQEKMRQDFVERENKSLLEEQQSVLLRKEASVTAGQVSESLKIRREMLEYIASADIEGRMVINLKPLSALKGTKHDILLEDGDSLSVPQTSSAIAVMGSVNNPTSVPFEESKGVEYYIHRTGGFTKHADKSGIYVIKANGEALSKFMMSKRINRGDTIVVPQTFKYWTPPGQLLRDTVEILSRVAIGVGIIAALN